LQPASGWYCEREKGSFDVARGYYFSLPRANAALGRFFQKCVFSSTSAGMIEIIHWKPIESFTKPIYFIDELENRVILGGAFY